MRVFKIRNIIAVLIIAAFSIINTFSYGFSKADYESKIEMIENETKIYSDNEASIEKRVKNVEIYVFGAEKNGNIDARLDNLASVLGINFNPEKVSSTYEIPDEENTDYPIMNDIELQILGKNYKNENIYKRLERLEQKQFGKISNGSLNERVSKLQEIVKPTSLKDNFADEPTYVSEETSDYSYYSPKVNSNYNSNSNSNDAELCEIEKNILGKTYRNDSIPNRLSRIENKYFGRQYADDSFQNRIDRIVTAKRASASNTEYKVNKFAKYAATGLQVGGLVLLILAMIL